MKSDEIIYCSRCGSELNRNARSCLKCGSINYEHPDNKNMKKYEAENKDYVYEVGQGQTINGSNAKNKIFNPSHTGNQKLCYLLNSLIYVGILILYGLICLISSDFVFDDFVMTPFPLFCTVISIIYVYIASLEIIFMKTNNEWWKALIPFYNIGVFSKITLGNAKYGFLYLIPVFNILLLFYSMFKLTKKFGYRDNKLVSILFIIYVPIIAFSQNIFNGKFYLDESEKNVVEKDYKRRRNLFFLIVVFSLFGIGLLMYQNRDEIQEKVDGVIAQRYVNTAEKILVNVKDHVERKKYVCGDGYEYSGGKSYYFYSKEGYTEFGVNKITTLFGDEAEVLIIVDVFDSENPIYYISISDGEKGFEKTLESELKKEIVKDYTSVDSSILENESYTSCSILSE